MRALEDAGYITARKDIVGAGRVLRARRRSGRDAFQAYMQTIERLFEAARQGDGGQP